MVRFYHKPDLLSIYSHQLCLRAHAERGHEGDSCCVLTRSVGTRGTLLLRADAERGHEASPLLAPTLCVGAKRVARPGGLALLRAHAERGHEGDPPAACRRGAWARGGPSCCVPTQSVGTRGTLLLRAHAGHGHEGKPSSRLHPSAPAIPFLSASYIDIMNQIT